MRRTVWEALSYEQRRAFAVTSKKCIKKDCDEPAGTPWGPFWCADHDDERIGRVSAEFQSLVAELRALRAENERQPEETT